MVDYTAKGFSEYAKRIKEATMPEISESDAHLHYMATPPRVYQSTDYSARYNAIRQRLIEMQAMYAKRAEQIDKNIVLNDAKGNNRPNGVNEGLSLALHSVMRDIQGMLDTWS